MSAALDQTLAALADPNRRRAVDLLKQGPMRAGELAQALSLSPPALSRHLRTLRQAGLVEEQHPEFDARVRIYALRPDALDELRGWLQDSEAMWSRGLLAFKAHVEREREPDGGEGGS